MRRTSVRNSSAGRAIKIADRAAQEQYKQMLALAPLRGHFEQAVEIFALETEDADGIDVTEFAFAHGQCGRGNLDGIVRGALPAAKSFENVASLLPLPLPSSATERGVASRSTMSLA